MSALRVALDARALTGRYTGDRTYWLHLIRALLTDLPADMEFTLYSRLALPLDDLAGVPVRSRVIPAPNDRIWTLLSFPRALAADRMDLAHTQYTTPLWSPCPLVTTVHDISFRLHPQWFPWKHRVLMNLTVPSSMRRARAVITDSESSRQDILCTYSLSPAKVIGIPLAPGPEYRPVPQDKAREWVKERVGVAAPFVLAVGVLQPRKNLATLVEAFRLACLEPGFGWHLVLVGKEGWAAAELRDKVRASGLTERVHFTGYVRDEDLPVLYSAAGMFAHPALYEGFGLPPVEAMACGTPVLVSDAPALPEVTGGAAVVLPARDPRAWADTMVRLAQSPADRDSLVQAGFTRVRSLTWARTAERTCQVYREAAQPRSRV